MKYYSYDNLNNYYIGEGEAQLDQLESKIQKKEIYLLPLSSTFIKPTLVEGKIAKFDGAKWTNIADNRGVYYSTTTKEQVHILEVEGDITGLTKLEPKHYDEWDGSKWIENVQAKNIGMALEALKATDFIISRETETIYDAMNNTQKEAIRVASDGKFQEKIADKKAKRQAYLSLL